MQFANKLLISCVINRAMEPAQTTETGSIAI